MSVTTQPKEATFTGCMRSTETRREFLYRHAFEWCCFNGQHNMATGFATHAIAVYDEHPGMWDHWNHNTEFNHWLTRGAD